MNTPHNPDNQTPGYAATPEELAEVHFTKWEEKRGVWPRLTHHEIFLAGHSAATVAMGAELERLAQTLASEREDGAKLKTRWDAEVNDLRRQLLESQALTEKLAAFVEDAGRRYGNMSAVGNIIENARIFARETSPSTALLAALEAAWKEATVRAREVSVSITLSQPNLHALWLASETRKRMEAV